MTSSRWQRLQELFEALIALPVAERAAWLDAQPDPADLKREALKLAAADGEAIAISPITRELRDASTQLERTLPLGTRLGAYRLIRERGAGGLGTVVLAERADDSVRQQVAINLLRGVPTRNASERMRRERQILADLTHPHIGRLLDGGVTEELFAVAKYAPAKPAASIDGKPGVFVWPVAKRGQACPWEYLVGKGSPDKQATSKGAAPSRLHQ